MISLYLLLLTCTHPCRELILAVFVEALFLISCIAIRIISKRRKSAQLKSLVLDEVLFQFRPLKLLRIFLASVAAFLLGLLFFVLLIDFSALMASKLKAFDCARCIYQGFPAYRLYDGAHPAFSLEVLSGACIEEGKYAEAHIYTQELLKIRESIYGTDSWMYGGMVANLGGLYYREGRFPEAEKTYRQSIRICRDAVGYRNLGSALTRMGNCLREQGKYGEASAAYQEALAMRIREFGADSPRVGETTFELALLMSFMKQPQESDRLFSRSLEIRQRNSVSSGNDVRGLILFTVLSMVFSFFLFSKNGLLTNLVIARLERRVREVGAAADPGDVKQLLALFELRKDKDKIDEIRSRFLSVFLICSSGVIAFES